MGKEGGVNPGPLSTIQYIFPSFRGQEKNQFCDRGVSVQVVFLRNAHRSASHATHARANGGGDRFAVHIHPSFFPHDVFVDLNVKKVLGLLRGGHAECHVPRFFHFNGKTNRAYRSINRCGLHARNFRRVATFRARNLQRNRCRVVSLSNYCRHRSRTNVTANEFGGHNSKFRDPAYLNVLGRNGYRAILRTSHQVGEFRLDRGVSFRSMFAAMFDRFRREDVPGRLHRILYGFHRGLAIWCVLPMRACMA